MPERKILSDNIVTFRRVSAFSQMEMAMECGISVETLSLIEREQANPTLDVLQKIAARMGITVAELLKQNDE